MKYLLLLLLAGCAPTLTPLGMEVQSPERTQISSGFDPPVKWTCEQAEINSALVWVECSFSATATSTQGSCIDIAYYEKTSGDLVASSRVFCSGPIMAGQKKEGYAAFVREERKKLNKCGTNMNHCVMLAYKRDIEN